MKYQIPQTVFIQEIDDEIILLDTITQEYFSLNEVGKNIIDLISENLTKDEMVEELSNIYEVDRIQIEKDLINFAKLLEEKGLITIKYILNNNEDFEVTDKFSFVHLLLFDSFKEKFLYAFYIFRPSFLDYQSLDKEYKSELVYYLIRPINILSRLFKKLK